MDKKRNNEANYKYDIGCWMTVYNRADLLIDATSSLLKCKDLTGIKFVFWNDGSTDKKIYSIVNDAKDKLEKKGNTVIFAEHSENRGKIGYDKTLKDCFKMLEDCKYIMPLPPDFVFNPYLFQTARKCFEYIKDKVKVITFSIDKRFESLYDKFKINEFFSTTKMVDWGPGIFDGKFVKEFLPGMKNINVKDGTGTTHTILGTARDKGYMLLQYCQSLCQHIGNGKSIMNPGRQISLINGRVNLDSVPDILANDYETIPAKKLKINYSNDRGILVVKSCGVGNAIAITPTIIKLKEIYPDNEIDLLVENLAMKSILENWKLLRHIYIDGDQSIMPKYEIIINGLPSRIDIKNLKGNKYNGEAEWYVKFMHEVEANLKILDQLKYKKDILPVIPDQFIPEPKSRNKLDKEYKGKFIGISAGFYKEMEWKNWGYEKFAKLALELSAKYTNHKILIFGIGKDASIFDYGVGGTDIINCVDKYSIQETAYLIGKCEFMVANDTGLSHISAAVKTKCYTLFGMTPSRKALPWVYGIEVSLNLSCSATCYYEKRWMGCKYKKCLKEMSVDFVLDRILEKEKYELGIMMATYDRYEMLTSTLDSVLTTFNDKSVKIAIVNDGSTDPKVGQVLFEFKKAFKGKTVILNNDVNKGKRGYPFTLRRAWNQLYDCRYILTIPDDTTLNRYSYEVFKKSYKYFGKDVKCITYFRDSRMVKPYSDYDKEFFKTKPLDKYFDISTGVDGFMCLFENSFLKTMNWCAPSGEGKTNFWKHFHRQLKDYDNLLYKETLCSHNGNISSIMWINKDGKRTLSIEGLNVNLFDIPLIVSGKGFEYSPEWYSEQYHGKGAYNLPNREYIELQDEWDALGYKKRFYEVLDDAERYIDFKDIKTICEVGCHHGKSVFWMCERFPELKYDAFDFSPVAVKWCQENSPFDNIKFMIGDVRDMPYKKKFDIVTCMDVGEHLPKDIYFKMIKELKRITAKYIIWYVGRIELEEHINLRSIDQQKEDLKELGDIIELPQYYLLVKVKNGF